RPFRPVVVLVPDEAVRSLLLVDAATQAGVLPIVAAAIGRAQAARVAARDRVVAGVAVTAHTLRIGPVQDGVGGDEPAGGRLVFARAEVSQAGGVAGAADKALAGRPGRSRAAGIAERVELPSCDGQGARVDGQLVASVRVGREPRQPARGAHGEVTVVTGGGDG